MNLSFKRWSLVGAAVLACASVPLLAGSALSLEPPDPTQVVTKVEICHRTNSNTNPYVINEPDASGDVNGHAGHVGSDNPGPVWNPTLKAQGIKWGDIIPPFKWSGGDFPGLNWTAEGQALYENDCRPLTPPVQVFGSLSVTKAVVVPANPAPGVPTGFSVRVVCDDLVTDVVVTFPAGGGAGTPATINDIEAGSTCTVVETGTASFPAGSSVSYNPAGANTTGVLVGANTNVQVVVTNTFPAAPSTPPAVAAAGVAAAAGPRFTG